jgi:hypothetical protein
VPVPYFLLFLYSRSDTQEIFSELDETSSRSLILSGASRDPKESRRGATGAPHVRLARPRPWPHRHGVRPPGSTSDIAPSPIKTPRWEKPKYPITFPEYIAIRHRRRPEDWEGPEALLGTLPERGIATGGLLHRHACLRSDE